VAFATPPLSVDASVAASAAANAVHALPASVALATLPSNMDAAVTVAANPAMLPPRRDASAIAVIPALPSATPALAAAARALAHTVPAPTSAVRAITPTATPNIPPRDALPVARSSAHRSRSRTSTNKAWRCLSVVSAILFALYCGAAWHQSCFPANLPCPSPARADTCGCSLCTTVGPRQLGGTQAVHASAVACPADILHATMDRALDSMPCSKAFTHHMLQWWGVPQHRGTVARQQHFRVYLVDTGIALLPGHEARQLPQTVDSPWPSSTRPPISLATASNSPALISFSQATAPAVPALAAAIPATVPTVPALAAAVLTPISTVPALAAAIPATVPTVPALAAAVPALAAAVPAPSATRHAPTVSRAPTARPSVAATLTFLGAPSRSRPPTRFQQPASLRVF
jgi:hypothetical protein